MSNRASASRGAKTTGKEKTSRRREVGPRPSIHVTRRHIQRPRTDQEFVEEYSRYSKPEQRRRLSLIGNITKDEFEHRLNLLQFKKDEIQALINQRELTLFERIALIAQEDPEYYKEVESEYPVPITVGEELFPPDTDSEEMADIPAWAQALLQNQ